MRPIRQTSLLAVGILASTMLSPASEPDLTTWIEGPSQVNLGTTSTFEVHYANLGPGDAYHPYLNLYFSAGFPARIDQLTDEQIQALEQSARGTDSHGNTPVLHLDTYLCEGLFFQLQGPSPPHPVVGLHAKGEGFFRFDLPTPSTDPAVGKLVVIRPERLSREYLPVLTRHQALYAHELGRYASGGPCSTFPFVGCDNLDSCFGPRLWTKRPFAANVEIVDDGGAAGDPSRGCGPLQSFTPGRVALIRNGGCSPYAKARYAQLAGASAVIVANDGRCDIDGDTSADCVVVMDGGSLAFTIDIPILMLSFRDGEDLIEAIRSGEKVTVAMGAMVGGPGQISSHIFSADAGEIDPDPQNNGSTRVITIGTFADSFETGSCCRWSCTHP